MIQKCLRHKDAYSRARKLCQSVTMVRGVRETHFLTVN